MAGENISDSMINFELSYSKTPATIIAIFGVISNILLLVAFIKDPLKCFRNSATYLVINLTVSDCLTCLVAPLHNVSLFATVYPSGRQLIYTQLIFWFGTTSMVSITSISIDRFLTIAYPLKHRILVRGKAMIIWLAIIWIVSSYTFVLKMFRVHLEGSRGIIVKNIPSTIVIFSSILYASTYYKLKKQSRNMALLNSTESRAQEKRILKEKRFLNTIILVACIALVCIVPSLTVFQLYNLTNEVQKGIASGILFINFAVNPLIYIARFQNYRKTFHLLYCSCRGSWLWKCRGKFGEWASRILEKTVSHISNGFYPKLSARAGDIKSGRSIYRLVRDSIYGFYIIKINRSFEFRSDCLSVKTSHFGFRGKGKSVLYPDDLALIF